MSEKRTRLNPVEATRQALKLQEASDNGYSQGRDPHYKMNLDGSKINSTTSVVQNSDGSPAESMLNKNVASKNSSTQEKGEVLPEDPDQKVDGSKKTGADSGGIQSGNVSKTRSLQEEEVEDMEDDDDDSYDDDEDEGGTEDDNGDDDDDDDSKNMEESISQKIRNEMKNYHNSDAVRQSMKDLALSMFENAPQELSEEFKSNAMTILEAAIFERSNRAAQILEEHMQTLLSEQIARLEEEAETRNQNLIEKVDEYLSYTIGEWMEENTLAVESGLKVELAESLFSDIKTVLEQNNIEVPDQKVDMFEELESEVETLQRKLNEQLETNARLLSEQVNLKKNNLIESASRDLTIVQKEKLAELSESVVYENDQQFLSKLETLKNSFIKRMGETPSVPNNIQEEAGTSLTEVQKELSGENKGQIPGTGNKNFDRLLIEASRFGANRRSIAGKNTSDQ